MYIDMTFEFYAYFFFFILNPYLLLSWMLEHDCLDTCCFGCVLCMCFVVLYFCICTCSAQSSMFRMEMCSANTLIFIIKRMLLHCCAEKKARRRRRRREVGGGEGGGGCRTRLMSHDVLRHIRPQKLRYRLTADVEAVKEKVRSHL